MTNDILSKIKLKETKKDIKVLDKAQDISAHMKNAFIRSKDGAENLLMKERPADLIKPAGLLSFQTLSPWFIRR